MREVCETALVDIKMKLGQAKATEPTEAQLKLACREDLSAGRPRCGTSGCVRRSPVKGLRFSVLVVVKARLRPRS